MLGQMMRMPLIVSAALEFAAKYHADAEIVSKTVEGPIHRYGFAEMARRARRLANALTGLGIKRGDIVGTLAWNGYRHVEIYYAVSGMGAVCHTINPRLFAEQITYIVNHAEDRYLFTDLTFVPLLESIQDELGGVKGVIIMTDRAHMPETTLKNPICYEELLAGQSERFDWPELDENEAASLCYTSGTTGNPKGVLYSHRSTLLHAMAECLPDAFNLSARDSLLPVVPMFHVNAWGTPYAAAITGCKLVLPGPNLDGGSLTALINGEAVTVTAGVPTVWFNLLNHLDKTGESLPSLSRVIIGGSAAPRSMLDAFLARGIQPVHAWGMTELSPLGVVNSPTRRTLSSANELAVKQGRPLFGIDLKLSGEEGEERAFDGASFGHLKVRGHWVCESYFREDSSSAHAESGWFATGDIATIDADGYMQIVDRSKDMIKSGGEWISSIDLENVAVAHPAVAEAAAIARKHDKWGERPIVIVTLKPGMTADPEELRAFFKGRVGKSFEPDEVIVTDTLPHTATGKLLKLDLRRLYGGG